MDHRFDPRILKQLLFFAAVVEEKSIRKGAARLNMSAATLLDQLNELEERLNLKLFERSPRGIKLSPVGLALKPRVDKFIAHAEMLDYSIRQFRGGESGLINIGANGEAMLFWIPKFKKTLSRFYPDISIFVKEIDSRDVEQELGERTVSFAIGFFRSLPNSKFRIISLIREKPIVIVAKDHPLARKEEVLLKDLREEDFVFSGRERAPKLFDFLVRMCEKGAGFTPRIAHEVESSARQLCFASCGQGITFLPASFKGWIPENAVAKDISDAPSTLQLSLAWDPTSSSYVEETAVRLIRSTGLCCEAEMPVTD